MADPRVVVEFGGVVPSTDGSDPLDVPCRLGEESVEFPFTLKCDTTNYVRDPPNDIVLASTRARLKLADGSWGAFGADLPISSQVDDTGIACVAQFESEPGDTGEEVVVDGVHYSAVDLNGFFIIAQDGIYLEEYGVYNAKGTAQSVSGATGVAVGNQHAVGTAESISSALGNAPSVLGRATGAAESVSGATGAALQRIPAVGTAQSVSAGVGAGIQLVGATGIAQSTSSALGVADIIALAREGPSTSHMCWYFNEGSGTTIQDQTANNFDGTLTPGSGQWLPTGSPWGDACYDFSSSSVAGVLNASMAKRTIGTIEFIVKFDSFAGNQFLWRETRTADSSGVWHVYVGTDGKLVFGTLHEAGGAHWHTVTSSSALSLDTAYHLAVRWTATEMNIFINGAGAGTTSAPGANDSASINSVVIGGVTDAYLNGKPSYIRSWLSERSAEQLLASKTAMLG